MPVGSAAGQVQDQKTQADFNLERAIALFDEALISKDERVINALRSLLMIVTLTAPEAEDTRRSTELGPFRKLYDEMHTLEQRMRKLENIVARTTRDLDAEQREELKYQSMKLPLRGILPSSPSIYDTSATDILKKLASK